jgi:hypothetical protein
MRRVAGRLHLSLRGLSENPNISKHSGQPGQEGQTSSAESVSVCMRVFFDTSGIALCLSCVGHLSSYTSVLDLIRPSCRKTKN